MSAPAWWSWRLLVAPAVLGMLLWQVGHGPFVDGVAALDASDLALATALAVPATVASAWRWRTVARALGAPLDLSRAVAASWASQFLNSTLPAGVAGDVYRGIQHAPGGDRLLGLRAVGWERATAQLVQVVLATAGLLMLPAALSLSWSTPALLMVGVLALVAVLAASWLARHETVRADLSRLRAAGVLPTVVVTSIVAQACFVATGLLAARTVGVAAPASQLVPLLLLMLVAMALPLSVAGWGPREGAAAWCFAAAGLGAEAGLSTAVAYGVLVTVASIPGALVLARQARRTAHRPAEAMSRA